MALEARVEKLEETIGSGKKKTREELLRAAWERFLTRARGAEVLPPAEEIEVNKGELDEHSAAWMDFLCGEEETIEIDIEGSWKRLIGKED